MQPAEDDFESVYEPPAQPGRPVDLPRQREPIFAAITGRPQPRRPIVPAAVRSRDQRQALSRWAVRYGGHTLAYHATRTPKYVAKTAYYAPKGAAVTVGRLLLWASAERHNFSLRQEAANRNDAMTWLTLDGRRMKQASWRMWVAIPTLLLAVLAASLVATLAPAWAAWGTLAGAVLLFARLGRPADKPITDRVVERATYRKLTAQLVRTALLATGYGKLPDDFSFPREIVRDGPGYSALVDLPHGVTCDMVMERRTRAAGALSLPIDQVWMKPGRHAGQVEMWVADEPISTMKKPAWPLLKAGQVDLFKPQPLGTSERGSFISILLMFTNGVIGAIPRMGKTFVLRLLLLMAALDPRVQLGVAELKGTGDLGMFERISRWYFVGDDDDEMDGVLAALRELRQDMRRRVKVIRDLPRDLCPENKVTPQLATMPQLGLAPVFFAIDECQVLFTDEERGKEAEQICTDLIKRGPAVGIMLFLATQRPDAKSLPAGISSNAGMRMCLRVMDQIANDMVLGTSMYKRGIRATQFSASDKGVLWLVGGDDEPMVVCASYVDGPAAERIVDRAVALRGGEISAQVRETSRVPAYNLLEDVRAVWVSGEDALWSELIVPRLAALRPEIYGDWTVQSFGAAMRAAGVAVASVHRKIDGRGVTRYGVKLTDLEEAITARPHKREIED